MRIGWEKNVVRSRRERGHEERKRVSSSEDLESCAEGGMGAGSVRGTNARGRPRGAGRITMGPGSQPRSLNGIWKVMGSRKRFKKGTDRSGLHFRKATQAVP